MNPPFKLKSGLFFVLIIIIFLVLNLTGFNKEIKNLFYLISSPIQRTFWQIGENTSDFLGGVFQVKTLKKEVERLYLENQELINQIASLQELKEENQILREILDIGLAEDFKLLFCQIISKDISKDSILVNKGAKNNVFSGLPVVTSQKVLLGRIGEVYKNFSEVILITNKESSFDAKVSEKETYGVVKGKGNLKLFLELIPKEEEIFQGEFVITAALGGIFPSGLLVGEIGEVKKSDIEPFQQAEIKPSFNLKNLDKLFIITEF